MEHTKSLGNQMSKPVKCIYYAVTLFGNAIWNKIPSRHLRKWFYQLLGAKMGKNTFPCRRVEILLPQGLKLGDGVAVGWFAELDARGGITVDHDTNISSHVKMITGSHDIDTRRNTRISMQYIKRMLVLEWRATLVLNTLMENM